MSLADDIRAAAFSREPTEIEDVICSVMFTDAELMLPTLPGDQYRTFMLICAEAFDDREARDRLEAARANAAREASQWAMEARTQRATVLDILRYFGLPENDWEALRLIQQAGINGVRPVAAQSIDTARMDRLEALYSETAHEPEAWRQFMGQVAALGFRESIDRVMSNPAHAPGVDAAPKTVDQAQQARNGGANG